jgi:SAM-dependent methyltransferase
MSRHLPEQPHDVRVPEAPPPDTEMRAEFDLLADRYDEQHRRNIAISGEAPEYFAEYKIADLAGIVAAEHLPATRMLDFGSGIGSAVPFFRKHFSASELYCADVSARSIEIARTRFPGEERHLLIDRSIPAAPWTFDIVFSACVFHHIPHEEHVYWLAELRRVTRPGGVLAIFEHNPLNPLTVRAVNTCPLDVNARLIRGGTMRQRLLASGWRQPQLDYRVFFPGLFRRCRTLEKYLGWLALGAQYRLVARAPE